MVGLKAGQPNIQAQGIAADVSTEEGVQQLASRLPASDILVNNLGIFEPKTLRTYPMPTGFGCSKQIFFPEFVCPGFTFPK